MRKVNAVVALVLLLGLTAGSGILAGNEVRLQAALTADLSAGDISGKAEFRQRFDKGGRRQFSVQVEGLGAGESYDVMVAGMVIGKIVIDQAGLGDINFDDNFEPGVDDPATLFPSNFPALDGGERIEVGPLSGTLQLR